MSTPPAASTTHSQSHTDNDATQRSIKRCRDEPKSKITACTRVNPAKRACSLSQINNSSMQRGRCIHNKKHRDERFVCPLCMGAINDVLESSCCGTLYCRNCISDSFRFNRSCPSCRATLHPATEPGNLSPRNFTHSLWIQREINAVVPSCDACGKNVFEDDRVEHKRQCEGRNVKCFKCSGRGAIDLGRFDGADSDDEELTMRTIKCDACEGNQFLVGLEWIKCFKCSGRGSRIAFEDGQDTHCNACDGRGALQGREWTSCFKCQGKGTSYASAKERHVDCHACEGKAALEGLDWTKCFKCLGKGAYDDDNGTHYRCYACEGIGALQGLEWTKCFKCKGQGVNKSKNGRYFEPCTTCEAKAALKGLDWIACFMCNGQGLCENEKDGPCAFCLGKGAVKKRPELE